MLSDTQRYNKILYCRLLLGDTMLNEDCFWCGFITSPMCECGSDTEYWTLPASMS